MTHIRIKESTKTKLLEIASVLIAKKVFDKMPSFDDVIDHLANDYYMGEIE